MYDVCIIGGGAAGMAAAITAAEREKKVLLIEKNKKLGRKIYSTGNGKCNVTNAYFDYSDCYFSEYKDYPVFIRNCMGDRPKESVISFMSNIGISLYEDNKYFYPKSNQASSVVWAMQDKLASAHVDIRLKESVTSISKDNDAFLIETNNNNYNSKSIIFACGGGSYSSIGGSYDGYTLAKTMKHNIVNVSAALCSVVTKQSTESIAGVRVKSVAKLVRCQDESDTNVIMTQAGELQINSTGLSGIMIFNLSSRIGQLLNNNEDFFVSIDMIENTSYEDFMDIYNSSFDRTVLGLVNTFINDKLAMYVLDHLKIEPKKKVKDMDSNLIGKIYSTLKNFRFDVVKLNDTDSGQVCHGGVDLLEINPCTMESKKIKNVYFTGEMLDVDGMCGGYNLTFAFLSGIKAGKNI